MDLAGQAGLDLRERLLAEVPKSHLLAFARWMCVRARFAEEAVEQAVADGVRQYVILGAGLDSFACRRGDLLDRLRVFEVDHPATQRWKRRRLADLGITTPAGLVFAPVDFERQALREALAGAGFDVTQRAVWSWIGVTMYLSLDAINGTLATMAGSAAGSRVVLTYNLPPDALDGSTAQIAAEFAGMAAGMGEPFVSRFLPGEMSELLRQHGFGELADFGAEQARASYLAGRPDVPIAGAQRLAAGTVMPIPGR